MARNSANLEQALVFPENGVATNHWGAEGTEFEWLIVFEEGTDTVVTYGRFNAPLKSIAPTDTFDIPAGGFTFESTESDA